MKTFQDTAGRTWSVAINVAAVKRVRATLNIDLGKAGDDGFKVFNQIVGDPVTLVDVIYLLCREEADAKGVSDEDFGKALAGDAITGAVDAFVEELVDFFPNPRLRAGMKDLMSKSRHVADLLAAKAIAEVVAIDPAKEAETLYASLTNSAASPGSIPGC